MSSPAGNRDAASSRTSTPRVVNHGSLVDFSRAGREAAHAAVAAPSAMQKPADRGTLHGYRIVNGRHRLELAGVRGCEDGMPESRSPSDRPR